MIESDWTCIARYRQGDVAAMDALVEKYRRPLYAFIWSKTGRAEEADDLFQETWFRALNKLSNYRNDNFFGWLVRIARNLAIDRARRQRPETSLDAEREDGRAALEIEDGRAPDPACQLARKDFSQALAEAVSRLPEEQREVFVLRTQGEVSFREIAKTQGTGINTALARMQYALDKLRRDLAGYGQERTS